MVAYKPFVDYFKTKYGCRLQKVVVDAGFGCPNRGGCTFCDNRAFHPGYSTPSKTITRQIDEGIEFHKVRYHKAGRYIAYFQPHTNTFAPLDKLKKVYEEALQHPLIEGIVVGTRPDCIDKEKLNYFEALQRYKVVILEYGVESCYNKTLERVGRGHDFECAKKAIELTAERAIVQCAHFIFGLPGETLRQMEQSVKIINTLPVTALKFHQLQILKGTALEKEFIEKPSDFHRFTLDEYLTFIMNFLRRLNPSFYIDRFAGEVPPRFISEASESWGLIRYNELILRLEALMREGNLCQGDLYEI